MRDLRIKHRHIALCVLLLCISLNIPLNNCAHFDVTPKSWTV